MGESKIIKDRHIFRHINNISNCNIYVIMLLLVIFIFVSAFAYTDTTIVTENSKNLPGNSFESIDNFNYAYDYDNFNNLNIYKLSSYIPEQKDPFIAGFLSWLMMGVGQIYCKEYTRGSIFIALDLLDKGALVAITSYVNNKYSPKGEEIININWSSFDTNTKLLILGYIIAKYGIRFYNVYDAIQAAKNYNKIHFLSRKESGFSFDLNSNSLQLGYSLEFK